MTLESSITQLDYSDGYLLVSTLTRTYICNTNLETFMQVGTKLRQGEYGGCFCHVNSSGGISLNESLEDAQAVDLSLSSSGKFGLSDCYEAIEEDQTYQSIKSGREKPSGVPGAGLAARIFCARPGTRIWEADHSGKVLVTHQLKIALMVPPADILLTDGSLDEHELLNEISEVQDTELLQLPQLSDRKDAALGELEAVDGSSISRETAGATHPPVSVAFTRMLSFYSSYLLAISTYGLYIIDPANSKILLWISVSDGVTDVKVSGNSLIYRTENGCIHNYMVTTVDMAILALHTRGLPVECALLCLRNQDIFIHSALLSRLGAKILTDLSNQIRNKVIKDKLKHLGVLAGVDKENEVDVSTFKSGITYIRNERVEAGRVKPSHSSALRFGRPMLLPFLVTRWYSDPHLVQQQEKLSTSQRGTVSVENSPVHLPKAAEKHDSSSTCMPDVQSQLSWSRCSSEDTLQSKSNFKSCSEVSTASRSSAGKSSSPDQENERQLSSPTTSLRSWSLPSDHRSLKSLESSVEMYEDPLFPSDDSSPDLDTASRLFTDSNQFHVNPYSSHNFYNLAYAPIHPGSEAAIILQNLMENVTSNMVGSITSGTKHLTERLKSVTPLMSFRDKSSAESPISVLDVTTAATATSGDTDDTEDFNTDIVVKTKPKKRYAQSIAGAVPYTNKSSAFLCSEDTLRPSTEIPGVVRALHELVTSTVQQITSTYNKVEAFSLLTHWLEVYCSTVEQIQHLKHLFPQASEDITCDGLSLCRLLIRPIHMVVLGLVILFTGIAMILVLNHQP